jgi:hypothetical protein
MILWVNFERPATCRHDMPHVVAYVALVGVVNVCFYSCNALHALGAITTIGSQCALGGTRCV